MLGKFIKNKSKMQTINPDKCAILYKAFLVDVEKLDLSVDVNNDVYFTSIKAAMTDLFRWNETIKSHLNVDKLSDLTGKQFSIMTLFVIKSNKKFRNVIERAKSNNSDEIVLSLVDSDYLFHFSMNDYILSEIKVFIPSDESGNVDVEYYKLSPVIKDENGDEFIEMDSSEAISSAPIRKGFVLSTF